MKTIFLNPPAALFGRFSDLPLMALVLAVAACGGGGSDSPLAGTCDIQTTEPVLAIRSATDTKTGLPIKFISLKAIKLNDTQVDLTALAALSKNITISSGFFVCAVDCGFGATEGKFTFTVSAVGYKDRAYTIDATFGTKTGSCPRVLSNGTKVDINLDPT